MFTTRTIFSQQNEDFHPTVEIFSQQNNKKGLTGRKISCDSQNIFTTKQNKNSDWENSQKL